MTLYLKRIIPIHLLKMPRIPAYLWIIILMYTAVLSYGYGQKSALSHQIEFAASITAPLPALADKDLSVRPFKR
jgi:hypothetical protein